MKRYTAKILLAACCSCSLYSNAQLVNSGDAISLSANSLIFVGGDFINEKGSLSNEGRLEVKGNFINKDLSSVVFKSNVSGGVVALSGGIQEISGVTTVFPSLTLSGTGQKVLKADIGVKGVLSLGNQHLKADSYTIHVMNSQKSALIRDEDGSTTGTGFISTDGKGALVRNTSSNADYLFPLGSVTGANILYRPLIFKPENTIENTFSASLVHADPTIDGYDKARKRYDVKTVSDKYYYVLGQKSGSSKFDITFFQNSAVDNNYTQLVNWGNYLQWEKAAPSSVATGGLDDDLNSGILNTMVKFSSIQSFQNTPFTFSSEAGGVNPFTFFNAFSPDGDSRNDTWTINNIELYPDNKLTIYNRWGDEVYSAKGYSNDKAWDGGNLQPGTYYYVLTATIENQSRVFKGFITMIKKN